MRTKTRLGILVLCCFTLAAHACMWDAHSLWTEKMRSHDLASAINGNAMPAVDFSSLQHDIKDLKAKPQENDPEWWNDLAGSYLRLNQPDVAVKILEPVASRFTNDYGIHANLGTAYHFLGRYADAEREIARDLEINTNAHFGLEKYHLALLQYLGRDTNYQSRHLYVDEYTSSFLTEQGGWARFYNLDTNQIQATRDEYIEKYTNAAGVTAEYERTRKSGESGYDTRGIYTAITALDTPPAYRNQWNLFGDTNFEAGVIYMAQMNPKEPACMQMLGMAAWKKHDYHLAAIAFEKAIALGSLQSDLLRQRVVELNNYISKSNGATVPLMLIPIVFIVIPISLILYYIYGRIRDHKRQSKLNA
jgi:hypothetical protein